MVVPTSACTLLSTVHGRDRRALRQIGKRDLQAAVRHGVKKKAFSRNGKRNWMYTFADIVYITDESSTTEITSYALPIEMEEVPSSNSDVRMHDQAACSLRLDPLSCTSHTVLVVDQSRCGLIRQQVTVAVTYLMYEREPSNLIPCFACRGRRITTSRALVI
jgi:hypothetical protein